MSELKDFFANKVLTQFTQCSMCGEENSYHVDPDFCSWRYVETIQIYCGNCFYQHFFDGYRIRESLGLTRDQMDSQFLELYDLFQTPKQ
jgi:hypothetical protein